MSKQKITKTFYSTSNTSKNAAKRIFGQSKEHLNLFQLTTNKIVHHLLANITLSNNTTTQDIENLAPKLIAVTLARPNKFFTKEEQGFLNLNDTNTNQADQLGNKELELRKNVDTILSTIYERAEENLSKSKNSFISATKVDKEFEAQYGPRAKRDLNIFFCQLEGKKTYIWSAVKCLKEEFDIKVTPHKGIADYIETYPSVNDKIKYVEETENRTPSEEAKKLENTYKKTVSVFSDLLKPENAIEQEKIQNKNDNIGAAQKRSKEESSATKTKLNNFTIEINDEEGIINITSNKNNKDTSK